MLEALKNKVYNANQDLLEQSGCEFSWISVSARDRESGFVILMPEGGALEPEDMAVLDLEGRLVEGKEPPVCDTEVHLQLYRIFPEIGSVAHPYSRWATVFAQLEMAIPTLGTIHSRTFAADIPAAKLEAEDVLCDADCAKVACLCHWGGLPEPEPVSRGGPGGAGFLPGRLYLRKRCPAGCEPCTGPERGSIPGLPHHAAGSRHLLTGLSAQRKLKYKSPLTSLFYPRNRPASSGRFRVIQKKACSF